MNKKTIILLILFACFVGILAGIYYKNSVKKTFSQTTIQTGDPVSIDIPAIHVHAHVEEVGVDKDNLMGVPVATKDVAWYKLGPQPGAIGNSVIDGHVDTQTGAPAVFANLKELKKNETITISETNMIKHTFQVSAIEELPTTPFPINRVFGVSNGSHLNLITCDGTWDKKTSNYTKRLVVFSKLIQ